MPVDAVTLQNEPQNRHPNGYPAWTCRWPGGEAHQRARAARCSAAGLHTKLLGYDHNWSEHPNDIAQTPPGEDPEVNYPFDLLDSGRRELAGRHRVPLLLRRPGPADRAAQRLS